MDYPKEFKYTKDHEWARIDGKTVTVGITYHAQKSLGDIVFVELPEVGRTLKTGETFGVVESIKAVSDLYSPVSGKVTAVNSNLKDDPAQINKSPHESAWMIKVEVADPVAIRDLMDASAYTKFVETLK